LACQEINEISHVAGVYTFSGGPFSGASLDFSIELLAASVSELFVLRHIELLAASIKLLAEPVFSCSSRVKHRQRNSLLFCDMCEIS
jgi:hypothetical protein